MHSVYMNQAAQGGTGPYTAMPVTGTGMSGADPMWVEAERKVVASISALSAPDPSMVNAYMYQPGAGSGQAAQQGQAVPTTTPAYSSYQPTATQGYQASEGRFPGLKQSSLRPARMGVFCGAGAIHPASVTGSLGGRQKWLAGPTSLDLLLLSLWEWVGIRAGSGRVQREEDALVPVELGERCWSRGAGLR